MAKGDARESKNDQKGGGGKKRRTRLRLLVVRHAIAEDQAKWAKTGAADADRPLTKSGRRKMKKAARGIVALEPDVATLATSPLVRTAQTTDILLAEYEDRATAPQVVRLSALAPGKSSNLLMGWLGEQPRGKTVAVVGHEPNLGQFVSWALTGLRDSFVELKKGAAVLIEFPEEVRPGHAKMKWAVAPGQLRAIGRGEKEC